MDTKHTRSDEINQQTLIFYLSVPHSLAAVSKAKCIHAHKLKLCFVVCSWSKVSWIMPSPLSQSFLPKSWLSNIFRLLKNISELYRLFEFCTVWGNHPFFCFSFFISVPSLQKWHPKERKEIINSWTNLLSCFCPCFLKAYLASTNWKRGRFWQKWLSVFKARTLDTALTLPHLNTPKRCWNLQGDAVTDVNLSTNQCSLPQ